MKKVGLIILLATLISNFSFAQKDAIVTYFNSYVQDESFSSVYVNPKLFKMISKVAPEDMDEDVRLLISKLEGLRILSSDTRPDGKALFMDAKKRLNPNEYEELMSTRDGDEEVLFLIKENGKMIQELLMITGSNNDFNMISFVGDIDISVLSKLAKNLDVDGMEHLDELENK